LDSSGGKLDRFIVQWCSRVHSSRGYLDFFRGRTKAAATGSGARRRARHMQLRSVDRWMDGWISGSSLARGAVARPCYPADPAPRACSTTASVAGRRAGGSAAEDEDLIILSRSTAGAGTLAVAVARRRAPAMDSPGSCQWMRYSGVWTMHAEEESQSWRRSSSSVVLVVWYSEGDVTWPVRGILRAHNVACRPLARSLGVQ
jgi:hypothetical protein